MPLPLPSRERLIDDLHRFDGVTAMGVDEYIWRHPLLIGHLDGLLAKVEYGHVGHRFA